MQRFHGQLLPPFVDPAAVFPSNASAQRAVEQFQQQALLTLLVRAAPDAAKRWIELRDVCGARESEKSSWPMPLMLTPSVHPPTTNSSPVFSFMHFNKGGGSTQKELIFELSRRNNWPHTGAGARTEASHFWQLANAHHFRMLWGSRVLGQASHTGRPVLYWTSMRDATARGISSYNQFCACGISNGKMMYSYENWTRPARCATMEAHMVAEAYEILEILLGFQGGGKLRSAVQACAAAGVQDKMMATLLELATTQLRQPCMSALRLSHIDADVKRLNERWARFGFALAESVPLTNAEQRGGADGTQVCTSPRLVDAHDPKVVARAEAAGQADPVGAVVRRLHKWHEAADDLWNRPLALCAH